MDIAYLRSSSYGTWSMCPQQYFFQYVLGYNGDSNKKADKGTIVHKVMEILAFVQLALQNKEGSFEDDIVGYVNVHNYSIDDLTQKVYDYYTSSFTHHRWTDVDYRDCRKWIQKCLEQNNGMLDPRNQHIIQPEQRFDIAIEKPWAHYDFVDSNGERIQGQLAIKGTIDLITKVDDDTYEITDYKTGRRLDWATGQEKTIAKLQRDPQLMLYYYAIQNLYPNVKNIIVTINFINDGGIFSLCFDKPDLFKVEMMLRARFEEIKNCKVPRLKKSWKCTKLCDFGKKSFAGTKHQPMIEYREDQETEVGEVMTMCEQIKHDIRMNGMDDTVKVYQVEGYNVAKYRAPGST